jgi:NADH-quinone oxidoreductase subunit C
MLNVDFNKLADLINKNITGANAVVNVPGDAKCDTTISIEASKIFPVVQFLKTNKEMPFNSLQTLSGVDYLEYMEVCYMMAHFSPEDGREFVLKTKVTDRVAPAVDSIVSLYAAANFQEREVYDMFGISFNNHPDLRRILCPDDWQGFPLRKDYVVQKEYNGMLVSPDNKMNFEDREFIVRQDMIKKAQTEKAQ